MKRFSPVSVLSVGFILVAGCSTMQQATSADRSPPVIETRSVDPQKELDLARRLAWDAAVMVQHPPHPAMVWQEARVKWRKAIQLLEAIPPDSAISGVAKDRLAVYRKNYDAIDNRLRVEEQATEQLANAKALAWQAAVTVQGAPHQLQVWQRASQKWQEAIAHLENVPPTASGFKESQQKLATYRQNHAIINQHVAIETQALMALKQFSEVAVQFNQLPTTVLSQQATDPVGITYEDYTDIVKQLETSFQDFAKLPKTDKHPVYPGLRKAISEYQYALRLWQAYRTTQPETTYWPNASTYQIFSPDAADLQRLIQTYQVKPLVDGKHVSLNFSIWAIWQQAATAVRNAQQALQKELG